MLFAHGVLPFAEEQYRYHFDNYTRKAEVGIYGILAVLLTFTALAAIADGGVLLWTGIRTWTISSQTLQVLDRLLIVLMLVEILHTVRISIRSHVLVTEPFLVVGLIASIRRILVITLEASSLTTGLLVRRRGKYLPRLHDGVGPARPAYSDFSFLHYAAPAVRAQSEGILRFVEVSSRLPLMSTAMRLGSLKAGCYQADA